MQPNREQGEHRTENASSCRGPNGDEGIVCGACGKPAEYSQKYEALYCKHCDEWLELKCPDATCRRCKTRPEKPMRRAVVTLP
jgi:predicted amidophosphoribosyltransferase